MGNHKDLFKILAEDNSILGHIQIRHSTVLSKRIHPNKIAIDKTIPEKPYSVTFRKTDFFLIKDIKTDDSQIHIIDWSDNKESFEVNLFARHTYKDKKIKANLFIYMNSRKYLVVPLIMDVQEFIKAHPCNIFLGVLEVGQEVKKTVDIVSKEKIHLSQCKTDLKGCKLEINKKSDNEATVHISFKVEDSMKKGPLKGFLEIDTDLTKSSIRIPIYGFIVRETD